MDSDTLHNILRFLEGHPRTYASRSHVTMQCEYCKDRGRPVQYVPTTYTHGAVRWDSLLSHLCGVHRVLPPADTVAKFYNTYLAARATLHGPDRTVPRACPMCKNAIDMTLQAGKDVLCFRCGHVHTLDASDALVSRGVASGDALAHRGVASGDALAHRGVASTSDAGDTQWY